ncbi:MAG: hypothetical protein EOP48_34165, partial [Sphingobacteriales bacterium]
MGEGNTQGWKLGTDICVRRNNDLRFFDCHKFDTEIEVTDYLKYNCNKNITVLNGTTKIVPIPKIIPVFMRDSIIDKKLKQ